MLKICHGEAAGTPEKNEKEKPCFGSILNHVVLALLDPDPDPVARNGRTTLLRFLPPVTSVTDRIRDPVLF